MNILKYIKLKTIQEFIDVENGYENVITGQEKILQLLEKLEMQKADVEAPETHLSDYITAKNIAAFCIFTGLVGLGFYLFFYGGEDSLSNSTLESLQSLGQLSKNLRTINQNNIVGALEKINDPSVYLSKEEIKVLIGMQRMLFKRVEGMDISVLSEKFFPGNPNRIILD